MTPEPPDLDEHTQLDEIALDHLRDNAALERVFLDGLVEPPLRSRAVSLSECRVTGQGFIAGKLPALRAIDCIFDRADFSSATWIDARLVRCRFNACKGTGLDTRGGELRDVTFHECKMPDALMPESTLDRVVFESCQIPALDLSSARIESVTIRDCDARHLRLLGARIETLDLRGSQIEGLAIDTRSLARVIVDSSQAPAFAKALGVRVLDAHEEI